MFLLLHIFYISTVKCSDHFLIWTINQFESCRRFCCKLKKWRPFSGNRSDVHQGYLSISGLQLLHLSHTHTYKHTRKPCIMVLTCRVDKTESPDSSDHWDWTSTALCLCVCTPVLLSLWGPVFWSCSSGPVRWFRLGLRSEFGAGMHYVNTRPHKCGSTKRERGRLGYSHDVDPNFRGNNLQNSNLICSRQLIRNLIGWLDVSFNRNTVLFLLELLCEKTWLLSLSCVVENARISQQI